MLQPGCHIIHGPLILVAGALSRAPRPALGGVVGRGKNWETGGHKVDEPIQKITWNHIDANWANTRILTRSSPSHLNSAALSESLLLSEMVDKEKANLHEHPKRYHWFSGLQKIAPEQPSASEPETYPNLRSGWMVRKRRSRSSERFSTSSPVSSSKTRTAPLISLMTNVRRRSSVVGWPVASCRRGRVARCGKGEKGREGNEQGTRVFQRGT